MPSVSPAPPAAPALSSTATPARYLLVMPMATQKGGAEMMFRHLVSNRPASEWVVVFLETGPMVAECQDAGIETHVLESGRMRQVHRFARTIRRLTSLIRSSQVHGVVSWLAKAHLYGGLAAQLAGVPAVWYQLAMPAAVHWTDRLATLLPAAGILTCSAAGADAQEQIWPSRPCTVVYPGVDLTNFAPRPASEKAALRRDLGLPTDDVLVGIVGRLQHWKGMHVFIDAIARLRDDFPRLRGVIVGGSHDHEPEYPSRLRQQMKRLGLDDAIIMTGFQSDPAAWMSTFDVCVHASNREPFGLVVVEAMALGLPVVASDTAGPTEVIADGETGLLAPFGNDATLARQIQRYLEAPDWAAEIGHAAQQRAQDFSAPAFADHVEEAVRTLVVRTPVAAS